MTRQERRKTIKFALTIASVIFIFILCFKWSSGIASEYTKEINTINTNNDSIILIDSTGKEWTLPKDDVKISIIIDNNNTDSNTKDDTIQKLRIKKED